MVPARKRGQRPGVADPTAQPRARDPNRGGLPSPTQQTRAPPHPDGCDVRIAYSMLSTVHISVLIFHRPSGSRPQTDNHLPAVQVVSPPALGYEWSR